MSCVGVQQSFPAFSCCMEPQEACSDQRLLSPLPRASGKNALGAPPQLSCSFLPSRYQEGLKKTEELQDLKEEEEEQKTESPEEPVEVEETEEEEKDQRSRLEAYTWIPNGSQVI